MHPVGVEPSIPASERPKTYVLVHAATGTGQIPTYLFLTILFHTHSMSHDVNTSPTDESILRV